MSEKVLSIDDLRERAARGNRAKFEAVLAKVPDVDPIKGDELAASPKPERSAQHHVVPHQGGWAVRRSKATQPSDVFSTKRDAEKAARKIAENQRTAVVIHGKDGRIEKVETYGRKVSKSASNHPSRRK
jgi:uncharacterized protein YdaT